VKPSALWAVLIAVVFLAYVQFDARRDGKLAERLVVADSIHKADSVKAADAERAALRAVAVADSLRNDAKRRAAVDAKRHAETDSALAASGREREAALRVAADSGATADALRDRIVRLAQSSVADSVSFARERDAHQRTVAVLWEVIRADSAAIREGLRATNAAIARAVAAERQRDILSKQKPRLLDRCGLSVGYGATEKGIGPAVLVGCKVAP